jgi:malate dehydrogenase (oxaloacetate-decarboxylating)
MVKAAAEELIRHLPTQKDKNASLLPAISEARKIGGLIATAVGKQAILDGQSQLLNEDALHREIQANIWEPTYVGYERKT